MTQTEVRGSGVRRLGAEEALRVSEADLVAWASSGTTSILVPDPLPYDDGPATIETIRLLRRAEHAGLGLSWQASGTGPTRLDLVSHLPAPEGLQDWAARWRAQRVRGGHYVRRGPGMYQVVRWRDARSSVVTMLQEPEEVARFAELLSRTEAGEPAAATAAAVDDELLRASVVTEVAGRLLVTATRVTRWPVPPWSR